MNIERINPDTLSRNPAFTQVVTVKGPSKLIFVGGQNGVNEQGKIVGPDIANQTEQAFKNVVAALTAAGATLQDVVKLSIYLVQGQSLRDAMMGSARVADLRDYPPAINVLVVAGLANPEFLIEIEAVAAVSE